MEDANGIPINVKIEGYWYSQYETQWPKPIPNALTESEAGEIFSLIKKKEKRVVPATVLSDESMKSVSDSIVQFIEKSV